MTDVRAETTGPITVLLADDDANLIAAMHDLIEAEDDMTVIGTASGADESVALAQIHTPDVVILDVKMPGGGGPSAARRIRQLSPSTAILAMSAYDDRGPLLEMIGAGAVGYLVKGGPISEILDAIHLAAQRPPASAPAAGHAVGMPGGASPTQPAGPEQPGAIGLMVVDDDPALVAVLADVIAGEPSIRLVGTAGTVEEAVRVASLHRPDVALVDARVPGGGGPTLTRAIRGVSPGTRVAAFSIWTDRPLMLDMLRAGASAYMVKGVTVAEIIETIKRTFHGQMSLSAEIASPVIDDLVVQLEHEDREREVRVLNVENVVRVLRNDLLTCVYQPVVDMRSGRIVGAEALARFPAQPARTPDVWFKEAEAVGLRDELELAAVKAALQGMPRLPAGAFLAVNISPRLAHLSEFHQMIRGTDPHRIVLEVAESMPVTDYKAFGNSTAPMRARGVRIAIDDAGLGYSLHHILQLEPHIIKLDIALCKGIDTDKTRRALTQALVAFADNIEAMIIAEGVETEAAAATLSELGVSFAQGFHYYRPGLLPIEPQSQAVPV